MGDDQTTGAPAPTNESTTAPDPAATQIPVSDSPPQDANPPEPTKPADDADFDLDLDQVVPRPVRVRYGGKIVEIAQPTTQQLFKLIRVGKELQSINENDPDLEKVDGLINDAMAVITEIAPELKDQRFGFMQVASLINTITRLTMPADNKELEARGVTPTETLKDATSSPSNSPTS